MGAPIRTDRKQFNTNTRHQRHRIAPCDEVECDAYLKGWRMTFELGNPAHDAMAQRVRESGRLFGEFIVKHGEVEVATWGPFNVGNTSLDAIRTNEGKRVMLLAPGQQCFKAHRVPIEPPLMRYSEGTKQQADGNRSWVTERDPAAFVAHKRETIERAFDRARHEGVAEMIRERDKE